MATVLITGANRGIGLELVKSYALRGDQVLAACRAPAEAAELQAVSGSVQVELLDVGDGASTKAFVERLGDLPIDLLINNAGAMGPPPQEQTSKVMDYAGWLETFNVNTIAPVRLMQLLHDQLTAAGGKAVTVTSQMGALSLDMTVAYAYCTSKAALNKFMKMAAIEWKADGVSVGVVHPGWVRTGMGGPKADISPEESADGIVKVIDGLSLTNTGGFWKWNGETHDW